MIRPVALRKESVDRNPGSHLVRNAQNGSLSARRAWIEILQFVPITTSDVVALRKESVDRNPVVPPCHLWAVTSLSARRAWIEILWLPKSCTDSTSLSARRAWIEMHCTAG